MNATSGTLLSKDGSQPYPAPINASVEDLRNDERVKTSLSGTIPDKGSSLDCLVRDISEGGAKIEIDATYPLAPNFDLVIAETRTLYRCELRWRYARAVGVKFVSSKPLADVERRTREELLAENEELKRAIAVLTEQLAELAAQAQAPKSAATKVEAKAKKPAAPRRVRAVKEKTPAA